MQCFFGKLAFGNVEKGTGDKFNFSIFSVNDLPTVLDPDRIAGF
jgi:hypothetical protein